MEKNPMKTERLNSLARLVPGHLLSAHITLQSQWLERTLDDSAGKRIYIPESFLITDANLSLAREVMWGMVVNEVKIWKRLDDMLPFLATEEVLSMAVKQWLPRQDTHEYIKEMCNKVWDDLADGTISENDLLVRMKQDPKSPLKGLELPWELEQSNYIGDSVWLCDDFIASDVAEHIRNIAAKNTVVMEESRV